MKKQEKPVKISRYLKLTVQTKDGKTKTFLVRDKSPEGVGKLFQKYIAWKERGL